MTGDERVGAVTAMLEVVGFEKRSAFNGRRGSVGNVTIVVYPLHTSTGNHRHLLGPPIDSRRAMRRMETGSVGVAVAGDDGAELDTVVERSHAAL